MSGEPGINFDSQWNMAAAYFFRMHTELAMSNHFGAIGDYKSQYMRLYNVHKELSGQMKPEELKAVEEMEQTACNLVNNKGVSVEAIRRALYNYEVKMRLIMKERKMDMPRSKDPGRAILDG